MIIPEHDKGGTVDISEGIETADIESKNISPKNISPVAAHVAPVKPLIAFYTLFKQCISSIPENSSDLHVKPEYVDIIMKYIYENLITIYTGSYLNSNDLVFFQFKFSKLPDVGIKLSKIAIASVVDAGIRINRDLRAEILKTLSDEREIEKEVENTYSAICSCLHINVFGIVVLACIGYVPAIKQPISESIGMGHLNNLVERYDGNDVVARLARLNEFMTTSKEIRDTTIKLSYLSQQIIQPTYNLTPNTKAIWDRAKPKLQTIVRMSRGMGGPASASMGGASMIDDPSASASYIPGAASMSDDGSTVAVAIKEETESGENIPHVEEEEYDNMDIATNEILIESLEASNNNHDSINKEIEFLETREGAAYEESEFYKWSVNLFIGKGSSQKPVYDACKYINAVTVKYGEGATIPMFVVPTDPSDPARGSIDLHIWSAAALKSGLAYFFNNVYGHEFLYKDASVFVIDNPYTSAGFRRKPFDEKVHELFFGKVDVTALKSGERYKPVVEICEYFATNVSEGSELFVIDEDGFGDINRGITARILELKSDMNLSKMKYLIELLEKPRMLIPIALCLEKKGLLLSEGATSKNALDKEVDKMLSDQVAAGCMHPNALGASGRTYFEGRISRNTILTLKKFYFSAKIASEYLQNFAFDMEKYRKLLSNPSDNENPVKKQRGSVGSSVHVPIWKEIVKGGKHTRKLYKHNRTRLNRLKNKSKKRKAR